MFLESETLPLLLDPEHFLTCLGQIELHAVHQSTVALGICYFQCAVDGEPMKLSKFLHLG